MAKICTMYVARSLNEQEALCAVLAKESYLFIEDNEYWCDVTKIIDVTWVVDEGKDGSQCQWDDQGVVDVDVDVDVEGMHSQFVEDGLGNKCVKPPF